MKIFILFLIRKRLKLKKYQLFQFIEQRNRYDFYYFGNGYLLKRMMNPENGNFKEKHSSVSLNWLLNDNCKILKLDKFADF